MRVQPPKLQTCFLAIALGIGACSPTSLPDSSGNGKGNNNSANNNSNTSNSVQNNAQSSPASTVSDNINYPELSFVGTGQASSGPQPDVKSYSSAIWHNITTKMSDTTFTIHTTCYWADKQEARDSMKGDSTENNYQLVSKGSAAT